MKLIGMSILNALTAIGLFPFAFFILSMFDPNTWYQLGKLALMSVPGLFLLAGNIYLSKKWKEDLGKTPYYRRFFLGATCLFVLVFLWKGIFYAYIYPKLYDSKESEKEGILIQAGSKK